MNSRAYSIKLDQREETSREFCIARKLNCLVGGAIFVAKHWSNNK